MIKKIWLGLWVFICIFQPPFLPIGFIYISGVFSIISIIIKYRGYYPVEILRKSGLLMFAKIIFVLFAYVVIVSLVDIFICGESVYFSNRIHAINQLVVLTVIEISCIVWLLDYCESEEIGADGVIELLLWAGVMQGLCSLLAYLIPTIRSFFLKYAGNIFQNAYVIERRGYGFSSMLLDTYGYGMGLLAGIALLYNRKGKILIRVLCIGFSMLSVILNARTGFIVLAIAVMVYFLFNSNYKYKNYLRILVIIVLPLGIGVGIPVILKLMNSSSVLTIRWVGAGLQSMYDVLLGKQGISQVSFLDDFSHIPDSLFEILCGSGHTVYGMREEIGFHSDVGYINLLWEIGIIGSIVCYIGIVCALREIYRRTANDYKGIVVFLGVSYFIVMLKAILIGYNPGVMVTYIMCAMLCFYSNEKRTITV